MKPNETSAQPDTPGMDRREFLRLSGTLAAAGALASAGCQVPQEATIPFHDMPENLVDGIGRARFFHTVIDGSPVLVKTREGRPIHVAGNNEHGGVKGKTSPRAMADVLRLYDPDRLRAPRFQGRGITWAEADTQLGSALRRAKADGRNVLLLTGAVASPSRKALIADLTAALPTLKHLAWDAAAGEAADAGARDAFGQPVEIVPRFGKARVILSLGSDFLNGADVEAVAAFASQRRLSRSGKAMNRLWALSSPIRER